jgi:hypothetical protein
MRGFENFQITSWLVDGLTVHLSRRPSSLVRRQKGNWKAKVALSAVTSAFAPSLVLAEPATTTNATWPAPLHVDNVQQDSLSVWEAADIVSEPHVYWASVISKMQTWKKVEPQEVTDDPPPLF